MGWWERSLFSRTSGASGESACSAYSEASSLRHKKSTYGAKLEEGPAECGALGAGTAKDIRRAFGSFLQELGSEQLLDVGITGGRRVCLDPSLPRHLPEAGMTWAPVSAPLLRPLRRSFLP